MKLKKLIGIILIIPGILILSGVIIYILSLLVIDCIERGDWWFLLSISGIAFFIPGYLILCCSEGDEK